jgi:pyruvate,orthophosphate dikinase
MARRTYIFSAGFSDGNATMRDLLGGKGANLAEMASIGLPVPPGFTITTDECRAYYANGKLLSQSLRDEVLEAIKKVEGLLHRGFGDEENPLLFSVRSGARESMPGMMDTILNLGLNDRTVEALAAKTSDRFAYDCYRRFIHMYGDVVLGLVGDANDPFEKALDEAKEAMAVKNDSQLDGRALRALVDRFKGIAAG